MSKSNGILYSREVGEINPVHIVFLHGFLGNSDDWSGVVETLSSRYHCVLIDLPGHGLSRKIEVSNLCETARLVEKTLSALGIENYLLVGYSMGARVAAVGAVNNIFTSIKGLVLEGANLGGLSPSQQKERLESDTNWSKQFATKPLCSVLCDWYQQPVFSSLSDTLKRTIIDKRTKDNGGAKYCNRALGKMLLASSLTKQDDLTQKIISLNIPIQYIVGEWDKKFCQLAMEYKLPLTTISQSGHNSHIENAREFTHALIAFIQTLDNE